MTVLRLIGPVDTVAVKLSGAHARDITMPDFVCVFWKLKPGDFDAAAVVKEAELDTFRMG